MTKDLSRPPVYRRERCQVVPLIEAVVLPELPNHEIHRDGRVFRIRGRKQGEVRSHIGNQYGHRKIRIMHEGIRHTYWLHRLICKAFHGDPPVYAGEEAHVRHLDADPSNNHADNLRYGSRSENERDKKRFYGHLVPRAQPEDPEEYDSEFFGS